MDLRPRSRAPVERDLIPEIVAFLEALEPADRLNGRAKTPGLSPNGDLLG